MTPTRASLGVLPSRVARPPAPPGAGTGRRRSGARRVRASPAAPGGGRGWSRRSRSRGRSLLSLLLLGPALGSGYVLSYDMVWVPQLDLRADILGLGTALPRAVPSDAVVAVLDGVVPGGPAAEGGAGRRAGRRRARAPRRWSAERSVAARLVAVTLAVWNPFVVERLVIGHWPLLVGYAVLPWLVVALRGPRRGTGRCRVPWLLLLLGSLSASAGLATAVAALAVARAAAPPAGRLVLLGWLLAANAPWLVAGLVQSSSATSDPAGAELFATAGEGRLPGPLAALSFGGVWNAEVVPGVAHRLGGRRADAAAGRCRGGGLGAGRPPPARRVAGLGGLVVCWAVGYRAGGAELGGAGRARLAGRARARRRAAARRLAAAGAGRPARGRPGRGRGGRAARTGCPTTRPGCWWAGCSRWCR